jgi:hypothetical protein
MKRKNKALGIRRRFNPISLSVLLVVLILALIAFGLYFIQLNPTGLFFDDSDREDSNKTQINSPMVSNASEVISPGQEIVRNLAQYVDYNGRNLSLKASEDSDFCSGCSKEVYSFLADDGSGKTVERTVELIMEGNRLRNLTFIS